MKRRDFVKAFVGVGAAVPLATTLVKVEGAENIIETFTCEDMAREINATFKEELTSGSVNGVDFVVRNYASISYRYEQSHMADASIRADRAVGTSILTNTTMFTDVTLELQAYVEQIDFLKLNSGLVLTFDLPNNSMYSNFKSLNGRRFRVDEYVVNAANGSMTIVDLVAREII